MERLPSVGSSSGLFLGSGPFDSLGSSSGFGSASGSAAKPSSLKPSETAGSQSSTSRSGLWGSSAPLSRSAGQWPLGSPTGDMSGASGF